ncbi:TPA: hypothetical protein ACSP3E_003226 [Aeromonas veronii]
MKIVKDKVESEVDMNVTNNIASSPTPEKKENWIVNTLGLILSGLALTLWHFAKKPVLTALRWMVLSGGVFVVLLLVREDTPPPAAIALSVSMMVIGAIGIALIRRD